jgi:hypothetical protein
MLVCYIVSKVRIISKYELKESCCSEGNLLWDNIPACLEQLSNTTESLRTVEVRFEIRIRVHSSTKQECET